jgi:hypothetical protein
MLPMLPQNNEAGHFLLLIGVPCSSGDAARSAIGTRCQLLMRAGLPTCVSKHLMVRAHFRSWHETDLPKYLGDVRCWVNSGNHMLSLSFSGFDPNRTSIVQAQGMVWALFKASN